MVDIPSDAYSSPPSSCGDDPDDVLLKMNWLRMEVDLPPLNSEGEPILDKEGQIRLTGQSLDCVFNRTEYTPDAEFYKVEAILRPGLTDDVFLALLRMGIRSVTVSDVKCFGDQCICSPSSSFSADMLVSKIKMEIVVSKNQVEKVIQNIIVQARVCGDGGDKIFLIPVADVIRISTGERGEKAYENMYPSV